MKKITKLLIIRHARTLWNEEGRLQGHIDTKILPEEEKVVRKAVAGIKDEKIRKIYSSPLTRARQTADLIKEELNLQEKVEELNDLAERTYGQYEGKKWKKVKEKLIKLNLDFYHDEIAGVEKHEIFLKRTLKSLLAISDRHPDEAVVVVTHGGNIKVLLEHLNCKTKFEIAPNSHFLLFEMDHVKKKLKFKGGLNL